MPNIETASNFLDTLNKAHSSVKFTMETECNEMLAFLDSQLLNRSPQIETKVYVKPTNSGLLLHFQSHVDNRYKKGLLRTMLDWAHHLSSSCLGHIFPTNVTVWKQYSHGWGVPNILLTLPSNVSLTQRFATSYSLYHHLKRQMTRFEWFYHLKTKSQQILWGNNLRIWA